MDWLIAAPFINRAEDTWLEKFVPGDHHRFSSVLANYRHDRSRPSTGARGWADYFQHGWRTIRKARGGRKSTGVITCFPQLATTVGLCKLLCKNDIPLLAWAFNVGTLHSGMRQRVSALALANVDRFVVHSKAEVTVCSEWLRVPIERFQFVPLQRPVFPISTSEDEKRPFVVSLGTAHRDYGLLCAVLKELQYPAIIVAGAHAVTGLDVPRNVEVRSGLSIEQCHELLQRARLNVIPVRNATTASGQVALLDAMMFARATVVTACPGSVDYVCHRRDAMLVRPGDHDDLKAAIIELWEDQGLRARLGAAARQRVVDEYSDEAVGAVLGTVLNQLEPRR